MSIKNQEKESLFDSFIRFAIYGALIGLAVVILTACLMALIFSFGILPISLASLLASISVAIGGLIGGFSAAKKLGKNGLLVGALTGLVLFIIFSAVSLIISKTAPSATTLIRALIFIISASVGGVLGVGSDNNKRKII